MTLRLIPASLVLLIASAAVAQEVGFVEDFALAKDRPTALKQLIPGTDEDYYYRCLQFQNTGQLDKVDELLKPWTERHGRSANLQMIERRQALLVYGKDPARSLDYLRSQLNLNFDHQKEVLPGQAKLPAELDPKLIARDTLTGIALSRQPNDLGGFEPSALDWLIAEKLDALRLRALLARLDRPDYPNLVTLVADDLAAEHSGGFGSLKVHNLMLADQLEALLKARPALLNDSNFVNACLLRLQPAADSDWETNAKEKSAYLDRLATFTAGLGPVHNSLKAHVLYQRLTFDRTQGVYDKARFLAYLKLPRQVGYVNPKWLERRENVDRLADLSATFATRMPPIGADDGLVRDYLLHFLADAKDTTEYSDYIESDYLKVAFAEAKIVNGVGDQDQWYSLMPPAAYQALRDRVDLDFAFTNKTRFAGDDAVGLDVFIKNVPTLIVKVYQINALNYYRDKLEAVKTDIALDGLVANEETTYAYNQKQPPLRRHSEHFDFPKLSGRGVYVVEFIGGGVSSRALVCKGRLHYLVRTGAAGHVFTVLDEANKPIDKDLSLYLAGHQYTADSDGRILVPFTTASAGPQKIVLTHGPFAWLDTFVQESEAYAFTAAFYVDRESLLPGQKATVLIRPQLTLGGEPVSLSLLENVRLTIVSTNLDGVQSTRDLPGFKLADAGQTTAEFQVPDRLASISFRLTARVENLSKAAKQDLAARDGFALNGVMQTSLIEDLFLIHSDGRYYIDVLGRTGEPLARRPVNLTLKHRDFTEPVRVAMQTDATGRVTLGELADIVRIEAATATGATRSWQPARDAVDYPSNMHGVAGGAVSVPYLGAAKKPLRSELSLIELRGEAFTADRFDNLAISKGLIIVTDLPTGDYLLTIKNHATIRIRLSAGPLRGGAVLGATRDLEVVNAMPLAIASASADKNDITVQLTHADKTTRVHVFATRYMPDHSLFDKLAAIGAPEPGYRTLAALNSAYVAGRNIGDEYRYILDRKYAAKFPGNMLTRPGLLLQPWAINKTDAGREQLDDQGAYDGRGGGEGGKFFGSRVPKRPAIVPPTGNLSSFDFLASGAVVLANLTPDDKGVVTIARKDLGWRQQVHIVAVDSQSTAYRELSLPEGKPQTLDLRLAKGLDPKAHFVELKQMAVLAKGDTFTLDRTAATSAVELYDSLPRLYSLYLTLSNDATLAQFGFILDWPKMKAEEKRAKYSEFACHELNFFLAQRDPEFFKTVIQPYLKNKKDKTFIDRWLIGEDLSAYRQAWKFGQLNMVERILLAQRLTGEGPAVARHVKDLYDLLPPDLERYNRLFQTALLGSALDVGNGKAGLDTDAPRPTLDNLSARTAAPDAPPSGATAAPMAKDELARRDEADKKLAAAEEAVHADPSAPMDRGGRELSKAGDGKQRSKVRQLYRKLDKTEEFVENNYYHLPIESQNAALVPVNAMWKDYAASAGKAGLFQVHQVQRTLSSNFAESSRNFPEIMFALSVLDVPFDSASPAVERKDGMLKLTADRAMIAVAKQIRPAEELPAAQRLPILVSQNFFRADDRYRQVDNERVDKYVTDEFLVQVVYGCQVVVTNPTSTRQKLDLLLQVPPGAIAVNNGQETRGVPVDLQPFATQCVEYFFYFPFKGTFTQFPVHVARNGQLAAFAPAVTLNVVETPSKVDTTSWEYISQNGSADDVLAFLKDNNVDRLNLDKMAWRMTDKDLFAKVIALLDTRHVYSNTLWAYAVKHNDVAPIRQFLQHQDNFLVGCGAYLDSPLVTIDPVIRKTYQHMEYSPLVNARAHKLGKGRTILNDRMRAQYQRLLAVLCQRPELDNDDLLSATYYLLLQDRIDEGMAFLARVDASKLETRLQYDYFQVYVDFYTNKLADARKLSAGYADYPVDRWRKLFANATAQIDEIEGTKPATVTDDKDRTQAQGRLAAQEPSLDTKLDGRTVTVSYQNLAEVRVNYYRMDIELMFSRNPFIFVSSFSDQFNYIQPNATDTVKLPADKDAFAFDLPKDLLTSNVMVEVIGGPMRKSVVYFSNAMSVAVSENYGQLQVKGGADGKPMAKVYVKAYARLKDGQVQFYKDGYTDLRGRFDYSSLNTNQLDQVEKFSILVLSETDGAVIREAAPPKQ